MQVFKDLDGKLRGKALVQFHKKADAETAVEKLNNYRFKKEGKEMKVNFKLTTKELDPLANVFIRNAYTPSNKELEDTVKQYGEVMSCMLKQGSDGKNLGYGYV